MGIDRSDCYVLNDTYHIYRQWCLGYGGYSKVFMGLNTETQQQIVAKKFKSAKTFDNEVKILTRLRKTSCVPRILHSCTMKKGNDLTCYIVMNNLNRNLEQIKTHCGQQTSPDNPRLTYGNGLYIMYELVQILKKIHKRGILHRDVKPTNIMVSDKQRLYLVDFGLAVDNLKYETNKIAGTFAFMSINSHGKGEKIYTPADDIESAYYTVMYLIKGYLPWYKKRSSKNPNIKKSSNDDILDAKKHITEHIENYPHILKKLHKHCVNIDPEKGVDYDLISNIILDYLKVKQKTYEDVRNHFFKMCEEPQLSDRLRERLQ